MFRTSVVHQPNSPYNDAQRTAWAAFDASLSLIPMRYPRVGYRMLKRRNPCLRGQNLACARMEKVLPLMWENG